MGTPREVFMTNEDTASLTAGEDVNIASRGQSSIGVREGIAMYAVGEEAKGEDPITETGARFHAAHGDTEARSLDGPTKLASESTMTLASTENNVLIHAPEHVLFNAGGAELKLTPTNIQLYAPGNVTFKASKHVFMGPKSMSNEVVLPESKLCPAYNMMAEEERGAGVPLDSTLD
jgi:type VI secretion system secreted protein VgrG